MRQSSASTKYAAAATPAAVTRVPGTPIHSAGPATARSRRQPTRMPPSNRITASATETMSSTAVNDRPPSRGQSAAAAAANRKKAGAGMRSRSLSRLESTAATTASAVTSTGRPKAAALMDLPAFPGRRSPRHGQSTRRACRRVAVTW